MQPLKAHVKNGHLVVDEPAELAEGQVFYLVPAEEDEIDDEKRAALDSRIEQAFADFEAGKGIPGHVVMAKLRSRA